MKKLLILLICSFAFMQTIQTKQIVLTVDDQTDLWSNCPGSNGCLDLRNYVDIVSGNYLLDVLKFERVGDIWDYIECRYRIWGCENGTNNGSAHVLEICNFYNYNSGYGGPEPSIGYKNKTLTISTECPFLMFSDNYLSDFHNDESVTLTILITGMFEDTGVGLQGDMNGDDILDIIDVIDIVNIILADN